MTPKTRSLREFRNPIGCLVLLAALAAAAGCSTAETTGGSGTNVNHILPSGSSVAGWLATPSGGTHASTATLDYIATNGSSGCAECHGSDLAGGSSNVSCFGNPAGCHHDPVANWTSPTVHGATAKKAPGSSGFASCQICHAADFSGGGAQVPCSRCHVVNAPHPGRPWRSSTGSTHTDTNTANAPVCALCHRNSNPGTPGCFNNTLCHGTGGGPHPVPYNDNTHYEVNTTGEFDANCANCHDITSTKDGPACQTCHVAASPLSAANCTSCHADPPDNTAPAGAFYPNIAGAHNAHLLLNTPSNPNGTPVSCSTCHNGLTSRTLEHYNRAKSRVPPGDVAFLSTYDAKTGASFITGFNCGNISCHGGGAPNWQGPPFDVNSSCQLCHAYGSSQFNSYSSGPGLDSDPGAHHTGAASCVECHNTGSLAVNHFTTLSTAAMEGPASATIGGGTTRIPAGNYVPATGSCTPTCHGTETW